MIRSQRQFAPAYTLGIPRQLYGGTTFNFTSAAVTTAGKRVFGGGDTTTRVCVRAQLPGGGGAGKGNGYWPAHWLLPSGCPVGCKPLPTLPPGCPTGACVTGCNAAEIDIMEMINGDGTLHGTYHWAAACAQNDQI